MDLGSESVLFDFSPAEIGAQVAVDDLVSLLKASFGGDRSEAGRYAANIRWQGNRKGDVGGSPPEKPLKEQIDETASALLAVSKLSDSLSDNDYETNRESSHTQIKIRGKSFSVPSVAVMEAEAQVNALGKRVLREAGQKVVESGFCTQQELDDAIAYQTRPPKIFHKSNLQRVLDGEVSHPDVEAKLDSYNNSLVEAKIAKSALLKASKEYNAFIRTEGYNAKGRELYEVRMEAKLRNSDAKSSIRRAERSLDVVVNILTNNGTLEAQKPLTPDLSKEAEKRFAEIHVAVGQEIKKTIGQYRPMAEKYPVYVQVSAPPSSPTLFIDGKIRIPRIEKQEKFVQEVASRFPQSLLGKIPSNVKVEVRNRSGGNWSQSFQRIVTDLEDADTFTHETVHALTFFSRSMRLMEEAALSRRTWGKSGDLTTPMTEKVKQGRQKVVGPTKAGMRFSIGKYIPDDFTDAYQGRIYPDRYTETLTVATENLFGGGTKHRQSGRADRDLMATALGALLTAEKTDG